jgi:hypothetical protein
LPDQEWGFEGPDDAAAYRRELGQLWALWLVALAALMFARGWLVVIAGAVALVGLIIVARPLQARAEAIVPDDDVPDPTVAATFRRSRRDRVLRELAYGEAPLEASGAGQGWIWGRRVIVGLTFAAFALVLYDLFLPGQ